MRPQRGLDMALKTILGAKFFLDYLRKDAQDQIERIGALAKISRD